MAIDWHRGEGRVEHRRPKKVAATRVKASACHGVDIRLCFEGRDVGAIHKVRRRFRPFFFDRQRLLQQKVCEQWVAADCLQGAFEFSPVVRIDGAASRVDGGTKPLPGIRAARPPLPRSWKGDGRRGCSRLALFRGQGLPGPGRRRVTAWTKNAQILGAKLDCLDRVSDDGGRLPQSGRRLLGRHGTDRRRWASQGPRIAACKDVGSPV